MRIAIVALTATLLLACQPGGKDDTATAGTTDAPAAATDPAGKPIPASPAPADAATKKDVTHPTLVVTTLDGSEYDLAARRGKWVVVNYWATWCNPCLKEMPELSALAAMREDIEVLGLAFEEIEPAAMKAFLDQHPVVYPIAIIDTYAPPADFDVPPGLPMTYVIAPDGRVERKILGPVTAADIEQIIAAATDGTDQLGHAQPEQRSAS